MTDEEWRPIEGFDGYEVSDQGRVRCWRPRSPFVSAPDEPRIVKPRRGTNGYLNVILGFKGKTAQIHRLCSRGIRARSRGRIRGRARKR